MPRQSLRKRASLGKKPAAIIAERSDAILQMNSHLKRRFNKLEKSVNDLRADNLRYYHQIGAICEEIRNQPDVYVGLDGTPGLRLIEQALSTQARTLRKAAMFAKEYNQRELDRLINLKNRESGFQLHWGHVSFLLSLPTAEKRHHFAQEAVEKLLDPPALHDLIKKRTHRSGGHGRKHEMPKTIAGQIRQILTISRQWKGKNDEVWNGDEESVFGNIMNMPLDDMEPDMVDQLTEIQELMEGIAEAAQENVDKAARAKEHMSAAITRRDQEAEAARTTGRQSRAIDLGDSPVSRGRRRAAQPA